MKRCKQCDIKFSKPYQYSQKQFDLQKFCSRTCMGNAYLGKRFSDEARKNMSLAHKTGISDEELKRRKSVRLIVRGALRNGSLIKGKCDYKRHDCKGQIEGHHHDYNQPLAVKWLCRRHHLQYHHGILA